MADITMCSNTSCKIREKCYRQQANPNPFWQSWAIFKPVELWWVAMTENERRSDIGRKMYCESFIEIGANVE